MVFHSLASCCFLQYSVQSWINSSSYYHFCSFLSLRWFDSLKMEKLNRKRKGNWLWGLWSKHSSCSRTGYCGLMETENVTVCFIFFTFLLFLLIWKWLFLFPPSPHKTSASGAKRRSEKSPGTRPPWSRLYSEYTDHYIWKRLRAAINRLVNREKI